MPATQGDLATEIRRLSDIEAIKALKARFVRLADAKDWEAWGREVLAEDCHIHNDAGPIDGRARIVELTAQALADATATHWLHAPEITITGPDTACAIWPVSDHISLVFRGTPMVVRGWGHYHDDYVRTADGWRLLRCRLVRQHVERLTGPDAERA